MVYYGRTVLKRYSQSSIDGHDALMKNHPASPAFVRQQYPWTSRILLGLLVSLSGGTVALADEQRIRLVADRAEAEWMEGAPNRALDILDQGIRDDPHAFTLQKLRADVLATSRGTRQAVQAYDAILREHPGALDVRWAKWSVLIRTGEEEHALAEF